MRSLNIQKWKSKKNIRFLFKIFKKDSEETMQNQEDAYQEIAKEDNHTILVPFTENLNLSII